MISHLHAAYMEKRDKRWKRSCWVGSVFSQQLMPDSEIPPNGGRKICALQTAGSSAKSRGRTKVVWPFSVSWNTKSMA